MTNINIAAELLAATPLAGGICSVESPELSEEYLSPRWYAAYTSANHEKRVTSQFTSRAVEHFCPMYESLHQWKDRRVKLALPLFPGYVFVRIALRDRLQVLRVPGVSCIVGFAGRAVPLPEEELLRIRRVQDFGVSAKPHPFLTAGKKVRVNSGPLQGLEGLIVKRKNATRFVVSVELLKRSVSVDLGGAELEPLPQNLSPLKSTGASF